MNLFCLAPDLHYLCTVKTAYRHNAQASLAILLPICVVLTHQRLYLPACFYVRQVPDAAAKSFLKKTNNYIP